MSWPWAAGRLAQDDRDQYRDGAKNLPGIEALIKDHPAKQGRNDGVEEAKERHRASAEPTDPRTTAHKP